MSRKKQSKSTKKRQQQRSPRGASGKENTAPNAFTDNQKNNHPKVSDGRFIRPKIQPIDSRNPFTSASFSKSQTSGTPSWIVLEPLFDEDNAAEGLSFCAALMHLWEKKDCLPEDLELVYMEGIFLPPPCFVARLLDVSDCRHKWFEQTFFGGASVSSKILLLIPTTRMGSSMYPNFTKKERECMLDEVLEQKMNMDYGA